LAIRKVCCWHEGGGLGLEERELLELLLLLLLREQIKIWRRGRWRVV